MAKISRYEDLIAWQKAYDLALTIYGLTRTFPPDERFGLTSQLRRGAVRIPSNIAEGFGRYTTADYLRFLDIAKGATFELQTQLRLAYDLDFHQSHHIEDQVEELIRVLSGLIRSLRQKPDQKQQAKPPIT